MADLNENETIIFNSASILYNISIDLKKISPNVSDALLFLSDRLLKAVEEKTDNEVEVSDANISEAPPKLTAAQIKHMETCPDCGGFKEPIQPSDHEHCPDCGGIKADSSNISIIDDEEALCHSHQDYTGVEMNENDPSTLCHGHTADGSGPSMEKDSTPTIKQKAPTKKMDHSVKIKTEVKSLIEEIRKGLK